MDRSWWGFPPIHYLSIYETCNTVGILQPVNKKFWLLLFFCSNYYLVLIVFFWKNNNNQNTVTQPTLDTSVGRTLAYLVDDLGSSPGGVEKFQFLYSGFTRGRKHEELVERVAINSGSPQLMIRRIECYYFNLSPT